jgi:mono/diheme cytochrome c family protein
MRIALLLAVAVSASAQTKVDFVRDIKPVFEKSCAGCHGAKAQLGGLRLDAKDLAAKTIHPGNAKTSSLYQRVAGIGEQARMPMGAKPLDATTINLIRRWIDEGADWPDEASAKAELKKHWAFIAPVKPAAPAVKDAKWVANPIDAFVLARLEKEDLKPAPAADRVTLLRRLSLDLIGLPPTIAEVDAFVQDKSSQAYERQVDRLLRSPHYGERWARIWLDAARYADSDGYEKDKARNVWFYRDWVINAFNRDLPYDRFVIEQIAGDLLPNATQDQKVATGFLRNSMINEEGGVDPEQFRMEAMFDRMDAVGKSILGITIQCAQCHNHKYDPLKQEEYYRLFAFMNDSYEGSIAVYTPAEQQKRAEIFRKAREMEADIQHRMPDWRERMSKWEAGVRDNQPEWAVIRPEVDDISTGGQKYLPLSDGSFLPQGYAPTKHKVKLILKSPPQGLRAIRLELLTDPSLPLGGPGRSPIGTGALTEFEVEADGKKVKVASATADLNLPERPLAEMFYDKTDNCRVTGPVRYAIDSNDNTAWGIDAGPGLRNQSRKAVFTFEAPVSAGELTIYLSQKHGGWNSDDNQNHNLGRFRLSVTTAANAEADPLPLNVREALAIPAAQRSDGQTQAIFRYWRTTVPEWQAENDAISELWKQHPEGSSQLVLHTLENPRMTHLLTRGDFLKPANTVQPGVPSFLHQVPEGAPPNRLTFAQWLVDRKSPTTARSIVNRIWQSYFGTGLVASSEDLGTQSEAPSHPELLDWLAVELMDRKWSLKALHRTIVMSSTYRQSSHVSQELLTRDPYNRLLAHGPRFRVDAEIVRDISLAAGGLLNAKIGGPSVFPPAPDFLFLPPTSYGPKNWSEDHDADRYRRALYTFRFRSVPYPVLQNFDAPNGDMSCVRRSRSNTPLQALTTLNETLFLEAARALASRTLTHGGRTDAERVTYAFRSVLSRKPEAAESDELLGLLRRRRDHFSSPENKAEELAGKVPGGASPADAAAWTAVSRVLLNLDETITKE